MMKSLIPTVIAISFAFLVLLGFLFPTGQFLAVRGLVTDWAVIVAALAVLLGILNIILSNWDRIRHRQRGWVYDLITIIALIGTILLEPLNSNGSPGDFYSAHSGIQILFSGIISASQASLAGLAVIFLITSAAQLYQRKRNVWSILFLASLIFVLVAWVPLGIFDPLAQVRNWFLAIPVAAGLRGLIIGSAIGILLFGIRFMISAERVYEEKDNQV